MIPDTLNYMIAGFLVILIGILAYPVSLLLRSLVAKQRLDDLMKRKKRTGSPEEG